MEPETLERILVPLDGSELSERILPFVGRLAERTGAEVRAIRVLDPRVTDALRGNENPYVGAAERLERALAPLASRGVRTRFDTYEGDPARWILDDSVASGASLIALSTHGRSGVDRWVHGSVAARVLREARVPVFAANPFALVRGLEVRRILVPLDGSDNALAVLPIAATFARANDAAIVLLHAVDERAADGLPAPAALEVLDHAAARLGDLPVQRLVEHGPPAVAILDVARATHADLVAMTTHGRSGVPRWVFGSTTEHVLQACSAPILIVRSRA